jgi:hypothetical protein
MCINRKTAIFTVIAMLWNLRKHKKRTYLYIKTGKKKSEDTGELKKKKCKQQEDIQYCALLRLLNLRFSSKIEHQTEQLTPVEEGRG